ncbi:outer membrane beta-barrel protein [Neptuniibacter halophilus]|uniref:outer membrane beta-barrel protein n=1 Tax=Neptuniibacter halophilus TaxID=651666 RepID=UPI0025736F1B|nr:outer membrane beta-barrel protein [Neptuniibacter halophilus]
MKKLLLASSAGLALAVSSLAQADGYYVFGDYGRSDFDTGVSAAGINTDDTDSAFSLGVGFQYNEYLAVELGYLDLGEASFSTNAPVSGTVGGSSVTLDGSLDLDATGFFLGLRGNYALNDAFTLFGRAGLLNWESDLTLAGTATIDGVAYTGSFSGEAADGTDPYLGLGVEYNFNENLSAKLQYNRYFLDFEGEDLDVDTFTAGLSYRF